MFSTTTGCQRMTYKVSKNIFFLLRKEKIFLLTFNKHFENNQNICFQFKRLLVTSSLMFLVICSILLLLEVKCVYLSKVYNDFCTEIHKSRTKKEHNLFWDSISSIIDIFSWLLCYMFSSLLRVIFPEGIWRINDDQTSLCSYCILWWLWSGRK